MCNCTEYTLFISVNSHLLCLKKTSFILPQILLKNPCNHNATVETNSIPPNSPVTPKLLTIESISEFHQPFHLQRLADNLVTDTQTTEGLSSLVKHTFYRLIIRQRFVKTTFSE